MTDEAAGRETDGSRREALPSWRARAIPLPDDASIAAICGLMRQVAGVQIDGDRRAFLRARLSSRLDRQGVGGFDAYVARLNVDPAERRACVEALTTHTTSFFRERAQYDWLRDHGLPSLFSSRRNTDRTLLVWSAACSTGQEGYSALMTIAATLPSVGRRDTTYGLVGTDISSRVLARARAGVYGPAEIAGLDEAMRRRFTMRARAGDGRVRIVPELRARSRWAPLNLLDGNGAGEIGADIVFLRNVLIYFSVETRARVLANVIRRLRPDGYLLVGHAEAGAIRHPDLVAIKPSIFVKVA